MAMIPAAASPRPSTDDTNGAGHHRAPTYAIQTAGVDVTRVTFYATPGGDIGRQDLWQGRPQRLVGFHYGVQLTDVPVDLAGFYADPESVLGMFPVFAFADGTEWIRHEPVVDVRSTTGALRSSGRYAPTAPCTNTPPCAHGRHAHVLAGDEDPLPTCPVAGCRCGRPPAGYRRVFEQRVWDNGGVVPAGVAVLSFDKVLHPAAPQPWRNIDCGPLVEVEPVKEDAQRTALADEARALGHALADVATSLNHWAGQDDRAPSSPVTRDAAGTQALSNVDRAIAELARLRAALAAEHHPDGA